MECISGEEKTTAHVDRNENGERNKEKKTHSLQSDSNQAKKNTIEENWCISKMNKRNFVHSMGHEP